MLCSRERVLKRDCSSFSICCQVYEPTNFGRGCDPHCGVAKRYRTGIAIKRGCELVWVPEGARRMGARVKSIIVAL